MQVSELNTLFKETHRAIQDNCPAQAIMCCNSILVTLKPYNNPYAKRMEKLTQHMKLILRTEWRKRYTKDNLLNALKCLILESQAQMKINRSA